MMLDTLQSAVADEPPSSVAVAAAEKAAARARRELERQQDWQCFIRQEAPRIFAAMISADTRSEYIYYNQPAKKAVEAAQALWDALPEDCKL